MHNRMIAKTDHTGERILKTGVLPRLPRLHAYPSSSVAHLISPECVEQPVPLSELRSFVPALEEPFAISLAFLLLFATTLINIEMGAIWIHSASLRGHVSCHTPVFAIQSRLNNHDHKPVPTIARNSRRYVSIREASRLAYSAGT